MNEKHLVEIKKSDFLASEYQACALNSIITILDTAGYMPKVDIDEIKDIFDYNEDGVHNMKYIYRKFNSYLADKKVPLRFNIRSYSSLQDVYKALHNQGIVPIFFWMKILHFTQKLYTNLDYQVSFGDVFQDDNRHALIFTGYDKKGDKIYFIDPSYQLPWLNSNSPPKDNYFELPIKDFYECTKNLKIMMEVKISKADMKKYKKEEAKNKEQVKLE